MVLGIQIRKRGGIKIRYVEEEFLQLYIKDRYCERCSVCAFVLGQQSQFSEWIKLAVKQVCTTTNPSVNEERSVLADSNIKWVGNGRFCMGCPCWIHLRMVLHSSPLSNICYIRFLYEWKVGSWACLLQPILGVTFSQYWPVYFFLSPVGYIIYVGPLEESKPIHWG